MLLRLRLRLAYLFLVLVACVAPASSSTDDASDAEAEAADAQPGGKADAADLLGSFASRAHSFYSNDLPSLELLDSGSYVRARCYHASCALRLPETDQFDTYTSSSGKRYLRFWTFTAARDANDELQATPVIADVYEVRTVSGGLRLRKSYTSTWRALYPATHEELCGRTGGAWTGDGCTCPGVFVAGAGGCIATPGASEDGCDTTDGLWTDDDATLIGSYCRCGAGRYVDAAGSCAAI